MAKKTIKEFKTILSFSRLRLIAILIVSGYTGLISTGQFKLDDPIAISALAIMALSISGSFFLMGLFDFYVESNQDHKDIQFQEIILMFFGGTILVLAAIIWAFKLSTFFALIILTGIFLGAIVYPFFIKKRTSSSVVILSMAGATPVLGGRILGFGEIDQIGLLLFLAFMLWLIAHIITMRIKVEIVDKKSILPVFSNESENKSTRKIIALSSIGVAFSLGLAIYFLGLPDGYLRLLTVLTAGVIGLSIISIYNPSEKVKLGLFKYVFMHLLGSMVLIIVGV